jgi:hypothetical protein
VFNQTTLGYQYWCEASLDGECWNRSYFAGYPMGVADQFSAGIEVFPNPFTDRFTIRSVQGMEEFIMYDTYGKMVSMKVMSGDYESELSGFDQIAPGVYYVFIRFEDGSSIVQKLINQQ